MIYEPGNGNRKTVTKCRCLCDCGKECVKRASALLDHNAKHISCGCLSNYYTGLSREKDIIGKRYGRLEVQRVYRDNNQLVAECICECGRKVTVNKKRLMIGRVKSCGCLRSEKAAEQAAARTGRRGPNHTDHTRVLNSQKYSGFISDFGVEILTPTSQKKRGCWLWRCRCPLCGKIFSALPFDVRSNRVTSCGCRNKSTREDYIAEYLTQLGVQFKSQQRFSDCRNIRPLPFDFAVYRGNDLACLIEYDGEQHFRAWDAWGGENGLLQRQQRDAIKTEYCANNKIPLLRLDYKDSLESIKTKIKNQLQQTGV